MKSFFKANCFPFKACLNYIKYSGRNELLVDIPIPLVIAIIIVGCQYTLNPTLKDLLVSISNVNNGVLMAISILAGFNVASISVLATSNSKVMEYLRIKRSKNFPKTNLFEMLMTFFVAAVILQLFIILIGLITLTVTTLYGLGDIPEVKVPFLLWLFMTLWIWIILVSIFVSIRNVKNLFVYVTKEY